MFLAGSIRRRTGWLGAELFDMGPVDRSRAGASNAYFESVGRHRFTLLMGCVISRPSRIGLTLVNHTSKHCASGDG
jgi:hypothetical protein